MKCKCCGAEIPEISKTVKVGNVEYETETHDFNKKLSDITIPKGWRLWRYDECVKLHNDKKLRKKLNIEECWFFIKQPFKFNEEKGYVARFDANSDGALLYCGGNPEDSGSSLGVRFARDFKKSRR